MCVALRPVLRLSVYRCVDCVDRKAAIAHRGRLHNNDAPRPGRCIEAPLGDEQVNPTSLRGVGDALGAGMVGPFRLC
jgi:hypothetical protein